MVQRWCSGRAIWTTGAPQMMVSREAFRAPGLTCLCAIGVFAAPPTARQQSGGLRPRRRPPAKWSSMMLFLRRAVGILELAGLQLRRVDDDRLAGLLELVDVVAGDAAVLHEDEARLLPFAVVGEFHVADDGVE